jgi:UDP-glucuronate 4-epimerase
MKKKRIFITGTAGFIGYHLATLLLREGNLVYGYDGITEYYDISLKKNRHNMLNKYDSFYVTEAMLEDKEELHKAVMSFQPDVIIHLAAQAGVRYSIENPRAYLEANIIGTFNVMETARTAAVQHLLMASTSSVYGANSQMPFRETDRVATPLTFYAASKLANEAMGHSYAHTYNIPITMFRFFTVYGPWGRPDMAYFKFVQNIIEGKPIDIYNNGEMWRDFTYVDDLVRGINDLINVIPQRPKKPDDIAPSDSLSSAAPYRIVNIGNSEKVSVLDFIQAIEEETGKKAIRNYMPMQQGDVVATWADTSLIKSLSSYHPKTYFREGIANFIDWFNCYYKKN